MPPKGKTVSSKKVAAATASKAKKPRLALIRKAPLSGFLHHVFRGVTDYDMIGQRSEEHIIGGFSWRLWLCRYGGGDHQLLIECTQSDETTVWYCDVDYKMTIKDAGYGETFTEENSRTLSMEDNMISSKHLSRYMMKNLDEGNKWTGEGPEPADFDSGAVDYVDVRVKITVKEAEGGRFRPKPSFDIYTADEKMYDVALAIGDKKIHVNKQFLSFHSSFFKDLFGSDKEKKEWKVDGVSPEDFAVLLDYLYRVVDKIDVYNWETLAKTAHKFTIHDLKDEVELFVIDYFVGDFIWSTGMKVLMADRYGMETYMEVTMEEMKEEADVEEVKQSEEYKEYSEDMKKRLDKKMEEVKKKLSP